MGDIEASSLTDFSINYYKAFPTLDRLSLLKSFLLVVSEPEQPLNWWEPGTIGLFDIGDASVFLGVVLAVFGIYAAIHSRWIKSLRAIIKEEIEIATAPIHPDSNGGLSLADVARRTQSLEKTIDRIDERSLETQTLLLKVLSNSVLIPDTAPQEEVAFPKVVRSRSRKKTD